MTEPLTPLDCDLRDFQFMPVDIVRLFGSRFHAIATDAEWRAGVTLWLKSFHQIPAGSIPNDEVEICRLAELGRDLKAWRKIQENALHGWILCSDGRLYHPTVCEKAKEAWLRKQMQRERSRKGNAKRWGFEPESDPQPVQHGPDNDAQGTARAILKGSLKESFSVPPTIPRDRDSDKERKKEEPPSLRDEPPTLDASPSAPPTPPRRGCRIPDDWTPADPGFAAGHGVDQAAALPEFRDYWRSVPGKAGVKLDWEATWRNQVRHIAAKPKKSGYPLKTSQMPVPEQNAELMRIMDRLRGTDDETPHHQLRIVQ